MTGLHKLSIADLSLQDSRLFVRVDFNVPLNQQYEVSDDSRMRAALPTLRYAREHGAKVILAAHLGRPGGTPDPQYSLRPVAAHLETLLSAKVGIADDCIGDMAYAFLKAQGLRVGNSLVEDEYEDKARQILQDAEQRAVTQWQLCAESASPTVSVTSRPVAVPR